MLLCTDVSHPKLEEAGVDNFVALAVKKGTGIHNKSHPKLKEACVDNFGALTVKKGLGIHSKDHPKLREAGVDSFQEIIREDRREHAMERTGGTADQTFYCLQTDGAGTANWHNGVTNAMLTCSSNRCKKKHRMSDRATFEQKKNEACINFPDCKKKKYKSNGKVHDSGKQCRTCYNE